MTEGRLMLLLSGGPCLLLGLTGNYLTVRRTGAQFGIAIVEGHSPWRSAFFFVFVSGLAGLLRRRFSAG